MWNAGVSLLYSESFTEAMIFYLKKLREVKDSYDGDYRERMDR